MVRHPKYPSLHLLTAPLALARPVAMTGADAGAAGPQITANLRLLPDRRPGGAGAWASSWPATDGRPGGGGHHHRRLRPAGRPAHRHGAGPSCHGQAVHLVVGRVARRSCCEACTPPSTTPWTQRACRCWAWSRRTEDVPYAPEHRGMPLAGRAATTPPGLTRTLPRRIMGQRSRP